MTAKESAYRRAKEEYRMLFPQKELGGPLLYKLIMKEEKNRTNIDFYFTADGISITDPLVVTRCVTHPEIEMADMIDSYLLEKLTEKADQEAKSYIREKTEFNEKDFALSHIEYNYRSKNWNSNYLVFTFRFKAFELLVTFWYDFEAFTRMIDKRINGEMSEEKMSKKEAIDDIISKLTVKLGSRNVIRGLVSVYLKRAD